MARLSMILALTFFSLGFTPPLLGQTQNVHLHAAFIFQFTKYIDWGDKNASRPIFVIQVQGSDALAEDFRKVFSNKQIQGLPVQIIKEGDPLEPWMVIFAGRDSKDTKPLPARCLTISIGDESDEAMIRLYEIDNHLKFDINKTLADQQGIYINSKLLKLAAKVKS